MLHLLKTLTFQCNEVILLSPNNEGFPVNDIEWDHELIIWTHWHQLLIRTSFITVILAWWWHTYTHTHTHTHTNKHSSGRQMLGGHLPRSMGRVGEEVWVNRDPRGTAGHTLMEISRDSDSHTHTYNRGRCSFLCVFSSCRHLTGEGNQAQRYAIKGTCSTQLQSFTSLLKVSCIAVPLKQIYKYIICDPGPQNQS